LALINNSIVTSGEKVIEIRKKFKFTQKDLAGNQLDRTLLSYIENGKINLTDRAAKTIVGNVNKKLKERNLEQRILVSDILMDIDEQIDVIARSYIELLIDLANNGKPLSFEMITEIEGFLCDKDAFYKKAHIYELLGDLQHNRETNNPNKSYTYYSKAFEIYSYLECLKEQRRLMLKVVKNRIRAKEYEDVIRYLSTFFNGYEKKLDIDDEGYYLLYYYWAQAYSGLGKFDLAIHKSKEALKWIPEGQYVGKAKILMELGQFYSSIGAFYNGNCCFTLALRMFEKHNIYSKYCDVLKHMIHITLHNETLVKSFRDFELERLSKELILGMKLIDSQKGKLHNYYDQLSRVYQFLGMVKEAQYYFEYAVEDTLKIGDVGQFAMLILDHHKFIKQQECVEELFNKECLRKISMIKESNQKLKEAIFIIVSLFVEKKNYEDALFLVKRF